MPYWKFGVNHGSFVTMHAFHAMLSDVCVHQHSVTLCLEVSEVVKPESAFNIESPEISKGYLNRLLNLFASDESYESQREAPKFT